jgi:D-amino-acid dehydrogenase
MHATLIRNRADALGRANLNAASSLRTRSALVIGAGVVGMATAYALARRGLAVTVVDAREAPGSEASFANGAQLSYAYTEALASPALLRHAPMVLLGLDPAIRLRPAFDVGQWAWLLRFLRNARGARFRANTLAGLELGLESQAAMQALQEKHRLDFGHATTGKLHIHDSAASFAAARAMIALKAPLGVVQEALTADQARRIEPALIARREPIVGAVWSPNEEAGDPHRFCVAMMALLTREYGVTMRLGTPVDRIDSTAQAAIATTVAGERLAVDEVVVCAGIGSRRFTRALGLTSALQPMKGYSLTAKAGAVRLSVSVTDVSRKIVFCPLEGQVRIAGLAELGNPDTQVDPIALARLRDAAQASLPGVAEYGDIRSGWAGIRPMSADSLPQIRRVKPRVMVNIGHGMLGWTFAMGSGERLAAVLLERGT